VYRRYGSSTNPSLDDEQLDVYLDGQAFAAVEAVDLVVAADDDPASRQFGVVVLGDGGAGWTGTGTFDVAPDRRSADGTASVQGNILVAEGVVDAAIAAFEASEGDLPDRLLAALVAGADEGGDSRCGDQTAKSAALIVARPGDTNYAFTDASVLGVDPVDEAVPSIFVSVLVEEGGDRAPDRLAEVWASADRNSSTVVIRDIDDGANTAVPTGRNVLLVIGGIAVLLAVIVVFLVIRSKRRTKPV
jgi:hypothetical protein